MTREMVLEAIKKERNFQDRKWGSLNIRSHELGSWLLIMEHELKEAKDAWTKPGYEADTDVFKEIIHVAAVAVACLEQHAPSNLQGHSVG